jgi:hypothetical protein
MSTSEFEGRSAATDFRAAWQRVITDPHGFFADMPETGGLNQPTTFLAICAALNAVGHLLLMRSVGAVVASFVWQMLAAFILAAVLVLVAQNLFEGRAGFEPTFRVVAYAWAPLVVYWVPLVGVLALIYSTYLVIRGLERVQGLDTTRAVLTVALGIGVVWAIRAVRAGHTGWL